jgi:hypothetical protein
VMIRLNLAMEMFLKRFGIDPANPPPAERELIQLLHTGIAEVDGCWLLASQVKPSLTGQREHFPDRTGYEAFINHIHISDVLGPGVEESPARALSQAIALGREVEKLVARWGGFEIVIATDKDSPADCNVRFYRHRSGEVWIERDLELYHEEGILVIETPDVVTPSRHGLIG